MAIVTALLGMLVETALLARRQLRVDSYARQAEWCADAGLARAASRLHDDDSYTGESWEVSPDPTHTQHVAKIEVVVDRATSNHETSVTVVAEFPLGNPRSVRRTLSLTLP